MRRLWFALAQALRHPIAYKTKGLVKTSPPPYRRPEVNFRPCLVAGLTAVALSSLASCAVTRGQQTVGAYIDDANITAQIKSRYVENKLVDATSISVETLNGTVLLSGFAKNATERATAESIARRVSGVRAVRNEIAVRP